MKHWQIRAVLIGLSFGVLSACGDGSNEQQQRDAAIPYQATASVHEYMVWVLEPAADVLWDSAGYILTEAGEEDLQPTTQEGWDNVRNAATAVAEAGNVLMTPGYRADDQDWVEYAAGIVRAGVASRDAALAKDAQALFDAGGQLYSVCRACHNKYIVAAAD